MALTKELEWIMFALEQQLAALLATTVREDGADVIICRREKVRAHARAGFGDGIEPDVTQSVADLVLIAAAAAELASLIAAERLFEIRHLAVLSQMFARSAEHAMPRRASASEGPDDLRKENVH
jgi:hypothetical protein